MESKVRSFEEDLRNSNNPTLRDNWVKVLKNHFGNDSEVIFQDEISIQKGMGTDATVKTSKGRRYSIELKSRNSSKYHDEDWIMEIVSHVYDCEDKDKRKHMFQKEGWIYTTSANYIFHGTLNHDGTDIDEVIVYTTTPFKDVSYKSEFEKYDNLWLPTKFSNGNFQLTLNKLIPQGVIEKDAGEFKYYDFKSS